MFVGGIFISLQFDYVSPLCCNSYYFIPLIYTHLYKIHSLQHQATKSLIVAALVASASAFAPTHNVATSRSTALFGVEEQVRELVKSQLNPDGDFEDAASFMDDLGADSLDAVELIMSLEEEFDIEIPDDEVEGITTVQAAIDFVKSKQ